MLPITEPHFRWLDRFEETDFRPSHALVDLALYREGLKALFETSANPEYYLIYAGTEFRNVMNEGPLLVSLDSPALSDFSHSLMEQALSWPWRRLTPV